MFRRISSLLLAFVLFISFLPEISFADTVYATVDGKSYTSIQAAWNAATNGSGHTLELQRDWNTSSRLDVHDNCVLTIEMNGYMINRGKTDPNDIHYASDSGGSGSVIYIKDNAKVTVQSTSGNDRAHSGRVISNTWYAGSGSDTLYGAVITGGATDSNYGGAFTLNASASLTLNHITVSGNVTDTYMSLYGNGAAIYAYGKNCTVNLIQSTLYRNYAVGNGGGIYVNNRGTTITMDHSAITNNYAPEDHSPALLGGNGGGIYVNAAECQITLKNGSQISGNHAASIGGGICYIYSPGSEKSLSLSSDSVISENEAGENGGGVYLNDSDNGCLKIRGGTISKNTAGKRGGGIYLVGTENSVSNCFVTDNISRKDAGGIYICEEDNTLSNVTITGNKATGKGGGVLMDNVNLIYTPTLILSNKVIIRDNTVSGKKNNLYLAEGLYNDPTLAGTPGSGSEIWVTHSEGIITEEPDRYDERFYYCDADGYYVYWGQDTSKESTFRRLVIAKGSRKTVNKVWLSPVGGTAMQPSGYLFTVSAGGENVPGDYKVYQGYMRDETKNDGFAYFFSDGYFLNDATQYNPHLATLSIHLAMSAFAANPFADTLGVSFGFTNKFSRVKQFMSDLGCEDEKTYIAPAYTIKPTSDSIAFAISQRPLLKADETDSGYLLIPVAIRGAGYESEWASNVTTGTSGEHRGFSEAANQVFAGVKRYIEKYDLQDLIANGKVRFWVAGFSRAAATTNLTAKRLVDTYGGNGNAVYAYCFEAPQGATGKSTGNYPSIHNCINNADFVTQVAPIDMDFGRWGVDHFVPGSDAGSAQEYIRHYAGTLNGSGTPDIAYYADNQPWAVKSYAYNQQRKKMLEQLYAVTEDYVFDDYFHLATLNPVKGLLPFSEFLEECGSDSVGMEDWLPDFFHYAVYWLVGGNARFAYAADSELNPGAFNYQPVVRRLMVVLQTMSGQQRDNISSRLDDKLLSLISALIKNLTSPTLVSDLVKELKNYKIIAEDALNITDSDAETLIIMALSVLLGDYQSTGNSYPHGTIKDYNTSEYLVQLGTFAYNMNNIVLNHSATLNLSWLRSYDSYYTDNETLKNNMYRVYQAKQSEVFKPTLTVNGNSVAEGETVSMDDWSDVKFHLTDANRGGAVYYSLQEENANAKGMTNALYQDGEIPAQPEGKYTVNAYTIWCDTRSEVASFTLDSRLFSIQVQNGEARNSNGDVITQAHAGETITITGIAPGVKKVFEKWKAKGGAVVQDSTLETTSFTMPESNVQLTAVYTDVSEYVILVENGTAYDQNGQECACAAPGEIILVAANPPGEKQEFHNWLSTGGAALEDSFSAQTTFVMPASEVNLTAVYAPAAEYAITVINGDASDARGSTVTSAAAGEIITLSGNAPDLNYVFRSWMEEGGALFESRTEENTTFVMPAADVTIYGVYVKKAEYAIYMTNGYAMNQRGEPILSASEGETVFIKAAPAEKKQFFRFWTALGGAVVASAGEEATSFVMPAGDVWLTANFAPVEEYSILILNGTALDEEGKVIQHAAAGETVTVISTAPAAKYVFRQWQAAGGAVVEDCLKETTTFVMPDSDVVLNAVFTKVAEYAITVGYGLPYDESGQIILSAEQGETITLVANAPDMDFKFEYWLVLEGKAVLTDRLSPKTTFVMPAQDIIIMAVFSYNQEYPITVLNGFARDADGKATLSALPGEIITVIANAPDQTFLFRRWNPIRGISSVTDESSPCTTFVMPDEAVTLQAQFIQKREYSITALNAVSTNENGRVITSAFPGDIVFVCALKPSAQAVLIGWKKDGESISTNQGETISFVMPDKDVTVEACFVNPVPETGDRVEQILAPLLIAFTILMIALSRKRSR